MEPRGATARYDAASDSYTLRSCSQGAGPQRDQLVAMTGIAREKLRVIDRGRGRRVRAEDRGLSGISEPAGRREAHRPAGRLDGDALGILPRRQAGARYGHARPSLRSTRRASSWHCASKHVANMGAFIGVPGAHIQTNNFSRCFPGMYAIPRIQVDVQCVFTNTVPTGPYRGAGRPEANYALERLVDEAARVTGIDPVKLRRRNLIPREGDSLQDRGRHHLRLRRFRADPREGAGARALQRVQEAAPRVVPAQEAARHRRLVLPRTCGRHADRERVAELPRRRTSSYSASACRTPDRATRRSIRA